MRKGLFGKGMGGFGGGIVATPEQIDETRRLEAMFPNAPGAMDGPLPAMQNIPTTAGGRFGNEMPAEAPQKSGGFFGQGGVGRNIAGVIGDVLLQQSGIAPVFGPQQQMQQIMAFRQAEEQRRRAAELADFRTQMQIRAEFAPPPSGPEIGTFEDNAGNVWRFDKSTGQVIDEQPVFVDRAQRFMNQNGAILSIPNPYAAQGGGRQPSRPRGQLTPIQGGTGGNVGGGFR